MLAGLDPHTVILGKNCLYVSYLFVCYVLFCYKKNYKKKLKKKNFLKIYYAEEEQRIYIFCETSKIISRNIFWHF